MLGLVQDLAAGGRTFGRYTLCERIARGGMGTVFRARALDADGNEQSYAIKIIHPHLAENPRLLQMFFREARLLSRLAHPNVCIVVDVGEAHGSHFLVLEYLDGANLSQLLRPIAGMPSISRPLAARIVADAARGLHAAHELRGIDGANVGLVHRDVSPQNLFVTRDGTTKVLDFGIARSDDEPELTQTGDLKGKLEYLAPEQFERRRVDRRVDVFALGIVLWEATTGRRLFRRSTEPETILAITMQPVPKPSSVLEDYPPALEAIVMRALARDPAARFASAADLADAIEHWIARTGERAATPHIGAFVRTRLDVATQPPTELAASLASVVTETGSPASLDDAATEADARSHVWTRRPRIARTPLVAVAATLIVAVSITVLTARPHGAPHATAPRPVVSPAIRAPVAPSPVTVAPVAIAPVALAPIAPVPVALTPIAPAPVALAPIAPAPVALAPAHDEPAPTHVRAPIVRAEGFLDLMAFPAAARVYEGSRVLGVTPMVHHAMSAGTHTLRLAPEAGGASREVTVTVRPAVLTRAVVRW